MRWLTVRLRARRINNIRVLRLMIWYLEKWQDNHKVQPSSDEEQQASLLAEFEIIRRRVTAHDVKRIREARKLNLDWHRLEEKLESTRIQRILGWEVD